MLMMLLSFPSKSPWRMVGAGQLMAEGYERSDAARRKRVL